MLSSFLVLTAVSQSLALTHHHPNGLTVSRACGNQTACVAAQVRTQLDLPLVDGPRTHKHLDIVRLAVGQRLIWQLQPLGRDATPGAAQQGICTTASALVSHQLQHTRPIARAA